MLPTNKVYCYDDKFYATEAEAQSAKKAPHPFSLTHILVYLAPIDYTLAILNGRMQTYNASLATRELLEELPSIPRHFIQTYTYRVRVEVVLEYEAKDIDDATKKFTNMDYLLDYVKLKENDVDALECDAFSFENRDDDDDCGEAINISIATTPREDA